MAERELGTAEALARAANVTKSTGYNWVGGGLPNLETLIRLADATDTNLDYWIGRTDDPARIVTLDAIDDIDEALRDGAEPAPRTPPDADPPKTQGPGGPTMPS